MKRTIAQISGWRNGLLADCAFSLAEATIVLFISSLYLLLLSINYGLATKGVDFVDAVRHTIASTLHPTEAFTYVTGILSSTVAYFVIRLRVCGKRILRILVLLTITGFLCWIATPLFVAGLHGKPANEEFAAAIARVVAIGAAAIWLYSLFSQRRVFERQVNFDGDRRGREIAEKVGKV